jgi:hypothetical protein
MNQPSVNQAIEQPVEHGEALQTLRRNRCSSRRVWVNRPMDGSFPRSKPPRTSPQTNELNSGESNMNAIIDKKAPKTRKTTTKLQTGFATTENQISPYIRSERRASPSTAVEAAPRERRDADANARNVDGIERRGHDCTAIPIFSEPPARAINYRQPLLKMRERIEAEMKIPTARTTLLYLFIQIHDCTSHGEHKPTTADLLARCPDSCTNQGKRTIRHLINESTAQGLLEKDGNTGGYHLLEPGKHYIRQACSARVSLWKINPRLDAPAIHAIVATEESDFPRHYQPTMDKTLPGQGRDSKGNWQDRDGSTHSVYQPLWTATLNWCRA